MPIAETTVAEWKDRAKAEAEVVAESIATAAAAAAARQKRDLERHLLHALESLNVIRGIAANPLISVTLTEEADDYAETTVDGVRFRWTLSYEGGQRFLSIVSPCRDCGAPTAHGHIEDTLTLGNELIQDEAGKVQCRSCWRAAHPQAPIVPHPDQSLRDIATALEGLLDILERGK